MLANKVTAFKMRTNGLTAIKLFTEKTTVNIKNISRVGISTRYPSLNYLVPDQYSSLPPRYSRSIVVD